MNVYLAMVHKKKVEAEIGIRESLVELMALGYSVTEIEEVVAETLDDIDFHATPPGPPLICGTYKPSGEPDSMCGKCGHGPHAH